MPQDGEKKTTLPPRHQGRQPGIRAGMQPRPRAAAPAGQLERTFRVNIFGYFFVDKAALLRRKEGCTTINTTSVTASTFGRPGQPEEMAPSLLFLASDESSYVSGQVLHPNGGEVVNG